MKDLQAIIDKRAHQKLVSEMKGDGVFNFLDTINLKELNSLWEKYDTWSINSIIKHSDTTKIIFDKNIDKYKEKEAELFVKEVEQLKERIAILDEDINQFQSSNV